MNLFQRLMPIYQNILCISLGLVVASSQPEIILFKKISLKSLTYSFYIN